MIQTGFTTSVFGLLASGSSYVLDNSFFSTLTFKTDMGMTATTLFVRVVENLKMNDLLNRVLIDVEKNYVETLVSKYPTEVHQFSGYGTLSRPVLDVLITGSTMDGDTLVMTWRTYLYLKKIVPTLDEEYHILVSAYIPQNKIAVANLNQPVLVDNIFITELESDIKIDYDWTSVYL